MPLYQFSCDVHGDFDSWRPMAAAGLPAYCPQCGEAAQRLFIMPAIRIVHKERLRYGFGSPGKVILGKDTGGLDIFVASDGALEQDEVDYVAEVAIDKERERVRKRKGARNETQAMLQKLTALANQTKPGQRARVLKQACAEAGIKVGK